MSVTATQLIEAVRESGATLRLVGEDIKVRPASVVPAELIQALREQKQRVVKELGEQRIESTSEVRHLIHKYFDATRFDPEEHPMPQAPPGGDPMVLRGTDKGRFFRRGGPWRGCWPKNFEVAKNIPSQTYRPMYGAGENRDEPQSTGATRFQYLVTWPGCEKLPTRTKGLDEQTGGQRLKTTPSILFMAGSDAEAWARFQEIKRKQTGGKDKVMRLECLEVRGDRIVDSKAITAKGG